MRWRALKYIAVIIVPAASFIGISGNGLMTFFPLFFVFGVLPVIEYFLGKDPSNLNQAEREIARKDRLYDVMLYMTVAVQVATMIWFLFEMKTSGISRMEQIGKSVSMGLMCGVLGINVAHELGHRTNGGERFLAKLMLSTTLFLHFYIEHNRGHHRNVGTMEDPATARRNEGIYAFWMRTVPGSFLSAWRIVRKERQRKGLAVWSPANELILYVLIELAICVAILFFFGKTALAGFLIASLIGILLLETVNYVEHYGLFRKKVSEHRYEDVVPKHSWNSDYILGRLVLFELTRHSDHHWEPSKHYQLLDSMPSASQLPAGYPAMMLLSLVPPVWFRVMNPRLPD